LQFASTDWVAQLFGESLRARAGID
jgi:hypothetical protein